MKVAPVVPASSAIASAAGETSSSSLASADSSEASASEKAFSSLASAVIAHAVLSACSNQGRKKTNKQAHVVTYVDSLTHIMR